MDPEAEALLDELVDALNATTHARAFYDAAVRDALLMEETRRQAKQDYDRKADELAKVTTRLAEAGLALDRQQLTLGAA